VLECHFLQGVSRAKSSAATLTRTYLKCLWVRLFYELLFSWNFNLSLFLKLISLFFFFCRLKNMYFDCFLSYLIPPFFSLDFAGTLEKHIPSLNFPLIWETQASIKVNSWHILILKKCTLKQSLNVMICFCYFKTLICLLNLFNKKLLSPFSIKFPSRLDIFWFWTNWFCFSFFLKWLILNHKDLFV